MRLTCRIIAMILIASPLNLANAAPAEKGANEDYWQTHSVVFGVIVGAITTAGEKPKTEISLQAKLRLSGTFDPGKVPEVSVDIDPTAYDASFKMPAVGATVLVVLEHKGITYLVPRELTNFMPGNHAPICTVKDFDDPKVKETLEAVQKLRHATGDSKPKDDSVKP